ncbi:MAG: PAS domain-containing protein [Rhodospirillales bacterium]
MNRTHARPTGVERHFGDEEIIVSKTDPAGRITYANRVFLRVAGYAEAEVLGQPHSLIRHPDMPRCVFKRLWDTIAGGHEIFAYVVNLAKSGDHYWVLAHVTPTFDATGAIVGYHSNRRTAERRALAAIEPLYAALRAEEARHENRRTGMEAAAAALDALLRDRGAPYDEFVLSL